MKFVSFTTQDRSSYGLFIEETGKILDLQALEKAKNEEQLLPTTLQEGITLGDAFIRRVSDLYDWWKAYPSSLHCLELDKITLTAPIPRPAKNVICVGKNYRDHAIEMGSEADIPSALIVFTKAPTSVTGHQQLIESHQHVTKELDYEGELAIVIGKSGRNIEPADALSHVFGYTIMNDITARDLQTRHQQYFIGKSLDTSCPIGPWIVHHTAIANPNQLDIMTTVNGDIRQQSNTKQLIFSIETIISTLSQGMTLEPGDIIATGTPAGVGKGLNPPQFLQPGDTIAITVEGIGTLINTIA